MSTLEMPSRQNCAIALIDFQLAMEIIELQITGSSIAPR